MKPNILFIAPFLQYCGWGTGVKDAARALNTVGNVTLRNIYLSNQRDNVWPDDLRVLYNNKYDHYDVLIYKILPNLYYTDHRFKQNIGIMVFETEFTNHTWLNKINMLDKLLVPSKIEKDWLSKKVKTPIFNISEALDISVADKTYIPINSILTDKQTFKFLFIGENTQRKGLTELLYAYLAEFSINDNVLLIIKTNTNISQEIDQIKQIMRKFQKGTRYPPIWLLFDRLNDDQIYSLHQYSQAFIMPSYGEAFNRPAATSLVFGKPAIVTSNTSMQDYVNEDIGWLIESTKSMVCCHQPPVADLYTSKEYWSIPHILSLRTCLREAYSNKELYRQKCNNIQNQNIKERFSYRTIGQNLLKAINS